MHTARIAITLLTFISTCLAQSSAPASAAASSAAASPTAAAGVFTIIKPLTNTQYQPGSSVVVTWEYSGYADDTTLALALADLRNGPNTGKSFAQLGSFPIAPKQATVNIPGNAPAGTFAISAVLANNPALYFSSPPIQISGAAVAVTTASAAVTTAAKNATTAAVATSAPPAANTTASKPSAANRGASSPFWYNFIPAIVFAAMLI
ncbi:hypothetical protein HDU97_001904 [Phlyctochytrium planicorne]|nr:hypothetical protein HDU97_001904 [Phlyctochytrium planicorne]